MEMFLSASGILAINELASRVHNSGHYTIEACNCSQFENHVRAVLGWPLGNPLMVAPAAVMVNLLGTEKTSGQPRGLSATLRMTGARLHLFGKNDERAGPQNGARHGFGKFGRGSAGRRRTRGEGNLIWKKTMKMNNPPLVGIIRGSASDWPTMEAAYQVCQEFKIPSEVRVVSAHRTPDNMARYAKTAHRRELRVLIAGAGGAAHLPGMVASHTPLPVIGVPMESKTRKGLDSLLAIVQMAGGIPVAMSPSPARRMQGCWQRKFWVRGIGKFIRRLLNYKKWSPSKKII